MKRLRFVKAPSKRRWKARALAGNWIPKWVILNYGFGQLVLWEQHDYADMFRRVDLEAAE